MKAPARKQSDNPQIPLPLELERALPSLRERLAQIQSALGGKPDYAAVNRWRWELGIQISDTLRSHAPEATMRPHVLALAPRLGCKASLLYGFVNVARAFPDEPPPQYWDTLVHLAAIEDPQRRQEALRRLPDWAPVRLSRPTREEVESEKMLREIKLSAQHELDAARHFVHKLPSTQQLFVAQEILEGFDEKAVAELTDPPLQIAEICKATERLRTLLTCAAAGPNEPPT